MRIGTRCEAAIEGGLTATRNDASLEYSVCDAVREILDEIGHELSYFGGGSVLAARQEGVPRPGLTVSVIHFASKPYFANPESAGVDPFAHRDVSQRPTKKGSSQMTEKSILRLHDVVDLTTISKSRLYLLMAREEDAFPRPIKLGVRSVGWLRCEVQAWLDRRERAGPNQA